MVRYDVRTGVKKIKTKTTLAISGAAFAFAGLTMALVIPLGAKAAVGGPVCNVPADYPTIQSAVNVPGCTTVNVAAGSYAENVTINHSLTLNGARAGVDARTRSGSESIINGGGANITVNANNVTVDGFTLDGPLSQGSASIVMLSAGTGETIQNNIINDPGRAVSYNTSSTTFTKNLVQEATTTGDGIQQNSGHVNNVTISNNTFSGGVNNNADITIISDATGSSNVSITGNTSSTPGTFAAIFRTNTANVTGNTVTGTTGSAIYIGGGDSNVTVSGNQVSSSSSGVVVANGFGDGPNSNITVTGNSLQNNGYGMYFGLNSVTNTVAAERNQIMGNTSYGVFNDPTSGSSVDGTCNWWGATSGPGPVGPGTGDKISSGVAFSPWLLSSNLSGACTGGTVNVATDKDQCKNNGWQTHSRADGSSFKNQGDCVSYTNTGR